MVIILLNIEAKKNICIFIEICLLILYNNFIYIIRLTGRPEKHDIRSGSPFLLYLPVLERKLVLYGNDEMGHPMDGQT